MSIHWWSRHSTNLEQRQYNYHDNSIKNKIGNIAKHACIRNLPPAEGTGCQHQFLTISGLDYCAKCDIGTASQEDRTVMISHQ